MKYDSTNIIGRKKEINRLFKTLKTHSVVLLSHRRMGKTFILKKMTSDHPPEFIPVFIIVEGKSNPEEFVHDLYKLLESEGLLQISTGTKFSNWWQENLAGKEFKDMKLPSFKTYWKEGLKKIIEDLLEQNPDKQIVIMIDEFPMMLYKFVKEYDLYHEAIEMIDTLREIRQAYGDQGIKFIYCGSIGMDIVLEILKDEYKYAGEPMNDMVSNVVYEMIDDDPKTLVKHLLDTKKIQLNGEEDKAIEFLCKEVDYLPFYIDLIITDIELEQLELTEENIRKCVENLISSSRNQGQFNHFSDRISTYYKDEFKKIAIQILSLLSNNDEIQSEEDIINVINTKQKAHPDLIKKILKKLFEDLYIERKIFEGKRFYEFKYTLLKRWWKINLG